MWKFVTKTFSNMERIRTSALRLLTAFLLILESSKVSCATLTAADKVGILGPNEIAITCSYTLENDEDFVSMYVSRKRKAGSYEDIVLFQNQQGYYIDQDIISRVNLTYQDGAMSMLFESVECSDEATYRCRMSYTTGGGTVAREEKELTFTVEVKPLQPSFVPDRFQSFNENDTLTLECRGVVGNPTGNYIWYGYLANGEEIDLTSVADPGNPYSPTGECYARRVSTLQLPLTRVQNNMVLRCTANQTTLGPPPTSGDICDPKTCRQTEKLTVFYPIQGEDLTISTLPAYPEYSVGSSVTLKCVGQGNPTPKYFWFKDGEDNVKQTNQTWQLTELRIEDTGTYRCLANNTFKGDAHNVETSVNIVVVPETTPAPTTTPTPTESQGSTAPTGGVRTTPATAEADQTVLIVVLSIVGVLIIVAAIIAFICIRRRRQKKSGVEEPPEKPYNNHNLSIYNTKPDLVTNDEKKINHQSPPQNYNKDDGLFYADLSFDDKPRSRRPIALSNMTDYADIRMPQV